MYIFVQFKFTAEKGVQRGNTKEGKKVVLARVLKFNLVGRQLLFGFGE